MVPPTARSTTQSVPTSMEALTVNETEKVDTMPPKGYVGIEVTARRKMLLREVMQAEQFNKATEALDFAIAYAQRFVKEDIALTGETIEDAPYVPNFINYYVGDARPLSDVGQVGGLVERAHEHGVGIVTSSDWRMDALNMLRNVEQTSMTLTDAIDFALTSYLMHARGGTIDAAERDAIKAQVRANQIAFRSELTEFRKYNMEQQERDARIDGTKNVARKDKKSRSKPSAAYNNRINALNMELIELFNAYRIANVNDNQQELARTAKLIDDKKAYIAKVTATREAYNDDVKRVNDSDEIQF